MKKQIDRFFEREDVFFGILLASLNKNEGLKKGRQESASKILQKQTGMVVL